MRIDLYLTEKGFVSGREKAKELIKNGGVLVDGKTVEKPSFQVGDDSVVEITGDLPEFVGRGGLKLRKATELFGIDLKDRVCMDIGASTGGFTDCMLREGAKLVYAVDVGHDQLAPSLRSDERVINLENTDIRTLSEENIKVGFVGCDVSFISLSLIFPEIRRFFGGEPIEAVFLIKPQFECGRAGIGKNGVVKDKKVHKKVISDTIARATENGFFCCGLSHSPICGGSGNIEYIMHVTEMNNRMMIDVDSIVENAFAALKGK